MLPLLLYQLLYHSDDDELQSHSSPACIAVAMLGGCLLSTGNLCFQWSVVVFGAPLTTVLAIQASLTVVLGTSLNYFLQPSKTARPTLLLYGVVAFLIAIGLASRAQAVYVKRHDSGHPQYESCGDVSYNDDNGDNSATLHARHAHDGGLIALPTIVDDGTTEPSKNVNGTLDSYNNNHAPERAESFYSDTSTIHPAHVVSKAFMGLVIAFCGGLCFGFFSPAFNIAVNNPFGFRGSGLSVAMANVWFSLAFCLCSVVGNVYLMTFSTVSQSSVFTYARESYKERMTALVGGFVCALGNVLQFQGGKLAGFATADLVQAFPLVATVWDVVVFGEFRHATHNVIVLLALMYCAYLLGVVLLACSIDY